MIDLKVSCPSFFLSYSAFSSSLSLRAWPHPIAAMPVFKTGDPLSRSRPPTGLSHFPHALSTRNPIFPYEPVSLSPTQTTFPPHCPSDGYAFPSPSDSAPSQPSVSVGMKTVFSSRSSSHPGATSAFTRFRSLLLDPPVRESVFRE